jgi:hypothetical protein
MCAIIGGIFTIAAVLDRFLYTFMSWILAKGKDFTQL